MTPAEWLAAIILGWQAISTVWSAVDKPYDLKVKSAFWLICAAAYAITIVVLSVVVLL